MAAFNAQEEKFIRNLHKHYLAGITTVPCDWARFANELKREDYIHILTRLQLANAIIIATAVAFRIAGVPSTDEPSITILPQICEIVSELDHRPKPNYLIIITNWLLSRWWGVAMFILWSIGLWSIEHYKLLSLTRDVPKPTTNTPMSTASAPKTSGHTAP